MNIDNQKCKPLKKKRGCLFYFLSVFLFLLFSFCVLLFIRYEAWFGNIPEEVYEVSNKIDRITLTPGEDFMSERTISWRCGDMKSDSKLEYFQIDSTSKDSILIDVPALGENIITRAGSAYYYHVKLSDLEKGAVYRYRVTSGENVSDWMSFEMPQSKDTLRFLYIGDVQDPEGVESDSLFTILRKRDLRFDFISFGGDQIERPMNKYWDIWYKSLGEWAGTTPLIVATGNHEYIKGFNKTLDTRWVAQHNYPENGPKDFKGRSYYIDFPLMRMIIIDSNIIQWPSSVFQHQSWLKKVLDETKQQWTVVMFHHGVHSVREGRSNPLMHHLFLPILEEKKVDLVLQGHDHAYSRITTKQGSDTIPPVFIISCASPKVYRNGFDGIHDRLGSGLALYQDVEITKEYLKYKSHLFDGETYDDLCIQYSPEGGKKVIDNARNWEEIFRFDNFGDNEKGKKKREKYRKEIDKRKSISH